MKYDKRQKTKAETAGFTLVEIVAVLVLLGILSAVAVPKFFDLSSDAEKKAAEAALMEAQVRINAGYSKAVYAGSTCEAAVKKVNTLSLLGDAGNNKIGKFEFKLESGDEIAVAPGTYVTLTATDSKREYEKLGQLFVPLCEGDSSSGNNSEPESGLVCPGNNTLPLEGVSCKFSVSCTDKNTCNCTCSCTADGEANCECSSTPKDDETKPDGGNGGDEDLKSCQLAESFNDERMNDLVSGTGCLGQDSPRFPASLKYKNGSIIQIGSKYYVSYGEMALSAEEVASGELSGLTGDHKDWFILLDENKVITWSTAGGWSRKLEKGVLYWIGNELYMYHVDSEWGIPPEGGKEDTNNWIRLRKKAIVLYDVNVDDPWHCWYVGNERRCQWLK